MAAGAATAAMPPGRSRGGREGREGERCKGRESQNGPGLHSKSPVVRGLSRFRRGRPLSSLSLHSEFNRIFPAQPGAGVAGASCGVKRPGCARRTHFAKRKSPSGGPLGLGVGGKRGSSAYFCRSRAANLAGLRSCSCSISCSCGPKLCWRGSYFFGAVSSQSQGSSAATGAGT